VNLITTQVTQKFKQVTLIIKFYIKVEDQCSLQIKY
jgi:hypothetical protein